MFIEVILYTAVWMSQLWLFKAFCTLLYGCHNYVYSRRFVHNYIDVTTMLYKCHNYVYSRYFVHYYIDVTTKLTDIGLYTAV